MNNFRKFKNIAIRWIALCTFRTTGPWISVRILLVPSCCDKSGTRCYHLVTRLMTATDLLQVVPTRLVQAVRITSCYKLVVINLLRADDIRLVGKTCCESVGLNLVTR